MTEHKNIAAALAAAQMEMGNALKDSDNPHFKSKYADLASVRAACLPALNQHGIAVIQPLVPGDLGHVVKTIFVHHASGETFETTIPLMLTKQDMQGLGSAITYARRYGLMALAGIAPDEAEDDDGEGNRKGSPMGASLGDAWTQGVLDQLPENSSPRQKAEAFANAICDGFRSKGTPRSMKALENEWDRRKKLIAQFEERFPDLHEKVSDAYESRVNELTESGDPSQFAAQ